LDEIDICYKMLLNNRYDTGDEERSCAGGGSAGPKEAHERVEDVKGVYMKDGAVDGAKDAAGFTTAETRKRPRLPFLTTTISSHNGYDEDDDDDET
jgi:hypothetical protein